MTSPLIPQKRMDKNGRLVTRHVSAPDAVIKAQQGIPAPSSSAKAKRQQRLSRLSSQIVRQMGLDGDEDQAWEITNTLEGYSDRLMERLDAVWKPQTQLSTALALMVYHAEDESFVREFAKFGGLVEDDASGMPHAMSFVRSLHHYPQLPGMDDYSEADEKTVAACQRIILMASTLNEHEGSFAEPPVELRAHDYDSSDTPVIKSGGLVQLVIDRPDDFERIAEIVLDRTTTDAQTIIDVMDHRNPALSSGVL